MPKAKKLKSISQRPVASWDERFEQLKGYKKEHKHCNVPQRYKANPKLATWVVTQRQAYKKGKLSEERINLLQGIEFEWECHKQVHVGWDERFEELKQYNDDNRHCNVPRGYKDNKQLANWVMKQRVIYKKGKLLPDRIKLLKEIGFSFSWGASRVGWDERLEELKQYKEEHGHCDVSQYDKDNKQLGKWVDNQRQAYKKKGTCKITEEQIKRLESIGFEWTLRKSGWDGRFIELKEYKQVNGHCNVPIEYKANPQLGGWVKRQRKAYKKGKLSPERIKSLEDVGFKWVLSGRKLEIWDGRFEQLKDYKKEYGDCNVSRNYKANPQLATWVETQRSAYKKNKLSLDRIKLLKEIGFEWELRKLECVAWDERLDQLKVYKEEHKNCNVPTKDKANPQLGKWVSHQRTKYKKGKLSPEQIKSLNGIGFKWVSVRGYTPSREGVDVENLSLGGEEGVGGETSSIGDTQITIPSLPPLDDQRCSNP